MKSVLQFITLALLAGTMVSAYAQASPNQSPASADDSDPAELEWMEGAPPAADKQVRVEDMGHYTFPKTRWSFSNFRQLQPSANIWRGPGPVSELPLALRDDLDAVSFIPDGSAQPMSWEQSLKVNYTDGMLVLHKGKIVYERYFGVTKPHTPHMSFSMTKSYYGTMAAMLIEQGKLDENALVSAYIPELANSGFGDATVRQVLDMTTGLDYSEVYSDLDSDVFKLAYATGVFPLPKNFDGADTLHEYLPTIGKQGEHGTGFTYNSVNTDVVAWLIARASGKNPTDLLSETIWQKLGAQENAYILVDKAGTGWASGGYNATLRDHARFGEMMRLGGQFNGQQIVPESIVKDIRSGGDKQQFRDSSFTALKGWSYRDQWWVSHDDDDVFAARGIHGQTIYIDPASQMVIVRLASHPIAANGNFDKTSLPAYRAIATHLNTNSP